MVAIEHDEEHLLRYIFLLRLAKTRCAGLKLLTRGPMPILVHETAHMENVVASPTAWIMG
jgi:hypothetical protein